tara:strand:+ start:155 stop:703 length:549 start_codon:yes stop_codon:yes gene_type:complete
MKFKETSLDDAFVIEPNVYLDKRGYFFESYNQAKFNKIIKKINFIQDNESKSTKGVLRGFHFQNPPFNQAKLVRCVEGKVLDVALDLRKKSKTYGQCQKVILTGKNKKQFFIPNGFAHAFLVLSNYAIFSYKVDNIYSRNHENGILWNDPSISIDWGIPKSKIIISEKDKMLSHLSNFNSPF